MTIKERKQDAFLMEKIKVIHIAISNKVHRKLSWFPMAKWQTTCIDSKFSLVPHYGLRENNRGSSS